MSPNPNQDPLAAYEDDELPRKPTSMVGFLIPVVLVCGLGAGALYFYKERVTTKEEVTKLVVEARDKVKSHDMESLTKAEKLYLQAIELDPENERALSALALVYFHQSEHGNPTLDKAKSYLSQAEALDAQRPERFAASAYINIAEGNPSKAEADMRALLERDLGNSRIAHALGWAIAEQGDWTGGNRIIRQAVETDFSSVNFRLTLAQIAMEQGDERGAVRHLSGILRNNMNPNHQLAKAWITALRLKNYGNLTTPVKALGELKKNAANLSPRAKAFLGWAEGELQLALLKVDQAKTKADEAAKLLPDFPPVLGLQARILAAQGKKDDAIALYKKITKKNPEYRGLRWDLARLLSDNKDDQALALVTELEKTQKGQKGPEFEIFRAEHMLKKGDLDAADEYYKKAAELGNDADILFGLAKITFEREKAKGKKADIEKVTTAISLALERKKKYPEVHEYIGKISLWNYLIDGAHSEYQQAETQYKSLRRPIPELLAFYDRTYLAFKNMDAPRKMKKQARKFAKEWKAKKSQYLVSIVSGQS